MIIVTPTHNSHRRYFRRWSVTFDGETAEQGSMTGTLSEVRAVAKAAQDRRRLSMCDYALSVRDGVKYGKRRGVKVGKGFLA